MKAKIKVSYPAPINEKAEQFIADQMKLIGARWYAQGTNLIANIREIFFDMDVVKRHQEKNI